MITLEHLSFVNKEDIIHYITNIDVSRYLTWKPYTEAEDIESYMQYAFSCNAFPDEIMGIFSEGKMIGTAHILAKGENVAQIGFGILPIHWNKGIGTVVLQSIIDHIKNSEWRDNTQFIRAQIHKQNKYAIRLILKQKFVLELENCKPDMDRFRLKI